MSPVVSNRNTCTSFVVALGTLRRVVWPDSLLSSSSGGAAAGSERQVDMASEQEPVAEHLVSESESSLPETGITAIARFEFETGKKNDGTKILLVEFESEEHGGKNAGAWEVTWPGKRAILAAKEDGDRQNRVYILLPPDAIIPPQITISLNADDGGTSLQKTVLVLPAIFPSGLSATARERGSKGVLHTVWAKCRLRALEREIEEEQKMNAEGVALEMAVSERDWIASTFGLAAASKPPPLDLKSLPDSASGQLSPSLKSPRTPGGRRLSEKLKGLSIGTSDKDLMNGAVNTPTREFHPLSPEGSDIAYSSFNTFRNGPTSPRVRPGGKTMTPASPPEHIKRQQQENTTGLLGYMPPIRQDTAGQDELFAIALSPRTPDVTKSPFSFQSEDIAPYAKIKGEKGTSS